MNETTDIDISFVIIGYNESEHLQKCLTSVQTANIEEISSEIIYVDGGSQDDSIEIAKAAGVDRILGGDRRRRAAENRNLGLKCSTGKFIQFIDGDMVMDAQWPAVAIRFLRKQKKVAAVCGNLRERNPSFLYQVFQIDWQMEEGDIRHCGGAACWRKEILEKMGGFPETVSFGEEPYLCWRVRNELGLDIYYLDRPMVMHDLGFSTIKEYVMRSVRCGETYAEVCDLCRNSADPLWLKETRKNFIWGGFLITMTAVSVFFLGWISAAAAMILLSIIVRKSVQVFLKGTTMGISLLYALHVYLSKVFICVGQCRWLSGRRSRNPKEAVQ